MFRRNRYLVVPMAATWTDLETNGSEALHEPRGNPSSGTFRSVGMRRRDSVRCHEMANTLTCRWKEKLPIDDFGRDYASHSQV